MNPLFTEFKIKNLILKNRIVMPPMCMYSAPENGMVTDWHVIHYATRAVGGAGLIIVEATGIAPEGRISANDLGIWDDAHVAGLSRIVNAVHECGSKIGIQLNHGGRKCEAKGVSIEAPSPLPYQEGSATPREMTKEDIAATVEEFRVGADRALKAGFDLIQIHGAHGYLINEYLSPLTNLRTDEYGGEPENRARFLGEVIDAVRTIWPADKPLEVRITAEDYHEGGNHAEDLGRMINLVKGKGVDLINVSTGGMIPVVPNTYPGYQIPQAEMIKQLTGLPVTAGGLLSDVKDISSILASGKSDLVYLGRELLRNPYWPLYAAKELGEEIAWPKQYERARLR
jgi:NADPH2 dehydrogenase